MKVLTILFGFIVVIIAEPPVQKTCLEDPETGVCDAYFPMWYYDSESGSCKEFVYGGCGGNGNRYETEQECLNNCRGSQKSCTDKPESGLCEAYMPMWYYDSESKTCKKFVYGGCGGNGNRYSSEQECLEHCKECGENSDYDSCGTYCPLTCDNYRNAPEGCILLCNPGCHCNSGYVKDAEDKCVKPEECPAKSEP